MNIIVCVKQVPASNETRLDPVTHTILRDGAAILNPFDAYAVEEALRLREKLGGEITALSMGVPSAQRMLRDVLALGVDRAVLLTDRAFAGSDTLATATALSAAVRHLGGAGLILCGRMASDGDTAQVGLKGSATKVTATSRPPVRGQCRRLTGTLEEVAQAVAQALRGKEADIHD